MASVTIEFEFSDDSTDTFEFEVDSGVLALIDDQGACMAEDLTNDLDEDDDFEIVVESWGVEDTYLDCLNQADYDEFSDLDDWGEYCEKVDEYGEAYCLRYADIGEHDFDDEFHGEWDSEEDFARQYADDCMEIPDSISHYFDYEAFASDLMMDYSSYEGGRGCYIFRA